MEAEQWKDPQTGITYHSTDKNMVRLDKNNYGIITITKIDHQLLLKFKKALEKGFVIHNSGSLGVKYIDNKTSKLKISDNNRLFSTKISNGNNKILHIFFEHVKKH